MPPSLPTTIKESPPSAQHARKFDDVINMGPPVAEPSMLPQPGEAPVVKSTEFTYMRLSIPLTAIYMVVLDKAIDGVSFVAPMMRFQLVCVPVPTFTVDQ
jgi:hypothetical protein